MSMLVNPYSVVPGGGDPSFSSVVQLAHFDGTNGSTTFTNSCPRGDTLVALGTGALSNAQSKWGTCSFEATGGNNGAVSTTGIADYTFGTGAFTIEFWFYRNTPTFATENMLFFHDGANGGLRQSNTGILKYYQSGSDTINSATGVLVSNTWQYISVSRNVDTYLHVGGVMVGSLSTDTMNYSVGNLYVGKWSTSTFNIGGFFSDLRVTKGLGRYGASNYSVPTAALPDS